MKKPSQIVELETAIWEQLDLVGQANRAYSDARLACRQAEATKNEARAIRDKQLRLLCKLQLKKNTLEAEAAKTERRT